MRRCLPSALLASLLCVALGCTRADAPQAASTADGAITLENVYDHERYWPAIVALTQEWLPPGETVPLKAQDRGTLVRVEPDGRVRIDGRHGAHDVPIDHTDLVLRANEVRAGTLTKLAPNFVLRVGNSLVDSSSPQIRPHKLDEIAGARGYLCVFADAHAEGFPALAKQLAALDGVNGVRTVFFPLSAEQDDDRYVHERLGAVSWPVPYMYPRLSADYTLSLLGELPKRPRVQLISPEGRVLYQGDVEATAGVSDLRRAVDGS